MDLELTETQAALYETCRQFADRELVPNARRWDEEHAVPAEVVRKLAELGLMGVAIPEAYGGAGMDGLSYALAMEEISRGCASTGVIMSVNNSLFCDPVYKFGNDAQKQRWLTPFASGAKLGCFGLTEPAAGSDAGAQKTVAVRDGAAYRISGSKNFITNGPDADAMLVFAMTDQAKGNKGITAFLVDCNSPGFVRGKPDRKLGITASHSCSMFFEDLLGPDREPARRGGPGVQGRDVHAGRRADRHRLASPGHRARGLRGGPQVREGAAGLRQADRRAAGHPVHAGRHGHRARRRALADLEGREPQGRGVRHSAESAMAKLFASETASRVANKALQIHGGYGYLKDFDVERHLRDARITEIYEGTSEIQRLVIASSVLRG